MKQFLPLITGLALAFTASAVRPDVPQVRRGATQFGIFESKTNLVNERRASAKAAASQVTLDDLLAAPEGSVFVGPYIQENAGFMGFQSSDQGRPDMATKYYQYYSGCPYTITGVRFIGLYSYWDSEKYDWIMCNDRAGFDENYAQTKPVEFEISFYKVGADGMPGECVSKKIVSLTGRYVGAVYGMVDNQAPLMEYICDLDAPVKLETGYVSFSATAPENEADKEQCGFCLFTATSSVGYGMVESSTYGFYGANPCIFSFSGPGDLASAKAVKVSGLTAPSEASSGTHETVRVSVANVGSGAISDLALRLDVDGKTVVTEKPGITIGSLNDVNYTFATRIDLSQPGEHTVTVTDVTPGVEPISLSSATVDTYTVAPGEVTASASKYGYGEDAITRVMFGGVDNESDVDVEDRIEGYQDFTSLSEDIAAGDELTISIESPADDPRIGVWVDWNNDGKFDGAGELMGYYAPAIESLTEDVVIKIPADVAVTPGAKTLRLVNNTNGAPEPVGEYYFGQTEDYTLNVVRCLDDAAFVSSHSELSSDAPEMTSPIQFTISNEGGADLNTSFKVEYSLPFIYKDRVLESAPADVKIFKAPVAEAAGGFKAPAKVGENPNPSESGAVYILHYDGDNTSAIGVGNYEDAVFGHLYPAEALAAVRGMSINSIDFYVEEDPSYAYIQVYEKQDGEFKVVYDQECDPEPQSWNRIVLDTPYVISGDKDVIYAVKITGMEPGHYYIGTDGTAAVRGFGDICNVGGSTWWSMADLGIEANFSIRANLYGELNPELSWLTLDKTSAVVAPAQSETITATASRANLADGTYEARILINTNDPLVRTKTMNVYMTNSIAASLTQVTLPGTAVKIVDGNLVVTSDKNVASVNVYAVNGVAAASAKASASSVTLPLDNCATGVYVVKVTLADGSSQTLRMALRR